MSSSSSTLTGEQGYLERLALGNYQELLQECLKRDRGEFYMLGAINVSDASVVFQEEINKFERTKKTFENAFTLAKSKNPPVATLQALQKKVIDTQTEIDRLTEKMNIAKSLNGMCVLLGQPSSNGTGTRIEQTGTDGYWTSPHSRAGVGDADKKPATRYESALYVWFRRR